MILDGLELEFYKWEGDLQELLQSVREKLNSVAEVSSRKVGTFPGQQFRLPEMPRPHPVADGS